MNRRKRKARLVMEQGELALIQFSPAALLDRRASARLAATFERRLAT